MARAVLALLEAYHGDLPNVCIRCGRPAAVFKDRAFSTGLLGLPLIIIPPIIMVVAGKIWVRVPYCELHRNHWQRRSWIAWTLLLSVFAMGAAGFSLTLEHAGLNRLEAALGAILCFGSLIGFVFWLILVFILKRSGIYLADYDDQTLTLEGVAPEFIEELQAKRAAEEGAPKNYSFRRKPVSWHFHFFHGS